MRDSATFTYKYSKLQLAASYYEDPQNYEIYSYSDIAKHVTEHVLV